MQMLEAQAICGQITVGKLHFYRREFYDLDRLWQDAKTVDLSEILAPENG